MDISIQHQQHIQEQYMSWFKKIILGLIIIISLFSTMKDYKDFGFSGPQGCLLYLYSPRFFSGSGLPESGQR